MLMKVLIMNVLYCVIELNIFYFGMFVVLVSMLNENGMVNFVLILFVFWFGWCGVIGIVVSL